MKVMSGETTQKATGILPKRVVLELPFYDLPQEADWNLPVWIFAKTPKVILSRTLKECPRTGQAAIRSILR